MIHNSTVNGQVVGGESWWRCLDKWRLAEGIENNYRNAQPATAQQCSMTVSFVCLFSPCSSLFHHPLTGQTGCSDLTGVQEVSRKEVRQWWTAEEMDAWPAESREKVGSRALDENHAGCMLSQHLGSQSRVAASLRPAWMTGRETDSGLGVLSRVNSEPDHSSWGDHRPLHRG